ncbi:hypothetical protein [Herbaspirillum chlorophenolicum]|uniref:hypothetical protein n=1 Tax=Herbaspirillum chlorophenolicum TaxID=211589 RepID=UPI00067AB924|nr:hypothetical protein [Herbaspirillum chlorophenolicum]
MYLLKHLEREVAGDKNDVAIQLLYKPWQIEEGLLTRHFPSSLVRQYKKLQEMCRGALGLPVPKRLLRHRLAEMRVHVYMTTKQGALHEMDDLALHQMEQYAGQAREDLHEINVVFDDLQREVQIAFSALYLYAEAFFYLLTKVTTQGASKFRLEIDVSEDLREGLRLYWFGHHAAFQSNLADMFWREATIDIIEEEYDSLEQAVKSRAPAFLDFVDMSIDKVLSLHPQFIGLIANEDKTIYLQLRRRAELIVYFFLKSHFTTLKERRTNFDPISDTTFAEEYDLETVKSAGFSAAEIQMLLSDSVSKGAGDMLLAMMPEGALKLKNLSLRYSLGLYISPLLKVMPHRGDWFDKQYISLYVAQRVRNSRFAFAGEVKAGREEEEKYDIDLFVIDYELDRIYFCQVKHRVKTQHAYLRDELKEFSIGGQFKDAMRQLDSAKRQLGSPKLLERVRGSLQRASVRESFLAKVDSEFLVKNTGFIVIHNVENLDFAVKDGVALYEWNTFRNLLKSETTLHSKADVKTVKTKLTKVALDKVGDLTKAYAAWNDAIDPANPLNFGKNVENKLGTYLHLFTKWEIAMGKTQLIAYSGKDFRYPLL